jgi:hypothetical protein
MSAIALRFKRGLYQLASVKFLRNVRLMFWLISGPSSVGKTTFIRSSRCLAITGLSSETPIIKPVNAPGPDNRLQNVQDCFVHYNILRPVSLFAKREARTTSAIEEYRTRSVRFADDSWWLGFAQVAAEKKALVLIANRAGILERARNRPRYKFDYWEALYEKLRLSDIYRAWSAELNRAGIPYTFVDTTHSGYAELDQDKAFAIVDAD